MSHSLHFKRCMIYSTHTCNVVVFVVCWLRPPEDQTVACTLATGCWSWFCRLRPCEAVSYQLPSQLWSYECNCSCRSRILKRGVPVCDYWYIKRARAPPRGVWGHAPPGKFWFLTSWDCFLGMKLDDLRLNLVVVFETCRIKGVTSGRRGCKAACYPHKRSHTDSILPSLAAGE